MFFGIEIKFEQIKSNQMSEKMRVTLLLRFQNW